ncbi:MAG: hypothetical protein RMA76_19645 [Deltaproteobacteria bacterium]|jgi:hypothetical protein
MPTAVPKPTSTTRDAMTMPSSAFHIGEPVRVEPSEMDAFAGAYFVSGTCGPEDLKLGRDPDDPADWDVIIHVTRVVRVRGRWPSL